LILSFLSGLSEFPADPENFVCKCSLGCACPGKLANEAHQIARDIKLAASKEKRKTYVVYEPTETDYAND
jgi:hypothetical protein